MGPEGHDPLAVLRTLDRSGAPNLTLTTESADWLGVFSIDLLPGAPPFDDLVAEALSLDLGELHVLVASRTHLIQMKRAAGRKKDLEDVAALEDPLLGGG